MNKLLMGACLTMAMQVGHSQTLPQLGKDPIEKIVAAMTAEEKVSLLVGTGMPGFGGQSAVVGSTQNIVPGAAGTTFPIERLGIPAIVVADGPAGLRISPTREGNEATYYCTAFPVATLLASTWNTALVKNVGNAMGDEVKEYGCDVLLAPALNIHRRDQPDGNGCPPHPSCLAGDLPKRFRDGRKRGKPVDGHVFLQ